MMRADIYLTTNLYTASRQKAKVLIEEGNVYIDKKQILKASYEVDESVSHVVEITNTQKFVSRGGYKLEGALQQFSVDPQGMRCLDIGASSGGFTDCLLQSGAAEVTAIDAGIDQLDMKLREDSRVNVIEKYNARELSAEDVGGEYDLVVMDVSFISQTYIIPNIQAVMAKKAVFISLLKPQFEAGRSAVGKNGIVKNRKDHLNSALRVLESANQNGLICTGFAKSPILGGDGNTEYLMCFSNNTSDKAITVEYIKKIIG